jgi:pimeloyl-ACP methyl ester carboxylesterase
MLVASLLTKVLWLLRYPSFDAELGPHKVGAIQTRIPGATACQIHYPTEDSSSSSKGANVFTPYFRPKAIEGLVDYSRTSAEILDFLSNRQHPCRIDAAPIQDQRFPIVVFSHGLGGCMEMYTELCRQIASYGFWVVAVEHEDGSGCYAENEKGEAIYYQRPDDSPYSRQKVVNFRRPFLQQRVEETTKILEYILKTTEDDCDPLLQKVLQAADTTKGISLLGHSFGGASMVLTAQKHLAKSTYMSISSLSLLDCWAFSLDEEVLQAGIPDTLPTLSVLSEAWLTNPERAQVLQLLQHSSEQQVTTSLHAPKSVHASFSDSVHWLPGFVSRKLGLRGKEEKRHDTIRSVAKACVAHMQNPSAYYDYAPLEPFPVDKQVSVPSAPAVSS